MKSTLYLKFIILYIIWGFLSLFTVSALTTPLITHTLEQKVADNLYQEANLVSSDLLPRYFSNQISITDVSTHLNGMRSYLNSTIWFTDHTGKMIASARPADTPVIPLMIKNFNPAECGGHQYLSGNYHGYFDEEMISVIAPVIQGFTTKGYILIHKPYDSLKNTTILLIRNILIMLVAIYVLSFIILIGVHFFVYRPLVVIADAAKQYASGNLDIVIPVDSEDEMGYLSASLNYMAAQLKDMEDYQKKFIANISHDFRSPLTSIKGYVEAMADGTIPPELQGKYLNIILFETERLSDLTQDLLTLNTFDQKNPMLDRTSFDIHEVIRNTAASFEGACKAKKISIELILASRNLNVIADKRKIQQVIYNLLDNAIKFSYPDSSIIIETTERIEKVNISVKDKGIGIPKNSLNKIWDRFYKTDLSRGKDKKGTGLGLAIVKEIIQAHHENINVISTEGVGTEFNFTLPKDKGQLKNKTTES